MADTSETTPPWDAESGLGEFADLVDAPIVALGLSSSAAAALEQALEVRTVRDLADNKYVRRAQTFVKLARAKQSAPIDDSRCALGAPTKSGHGMLGPRTVSSSSRSTASAGRTVSWP
jgi:hypothetical protein